MLLAFDTSGPHCTVVLAQPDGAVTAYGSEEIGRGHAERLMGLVDHVMGEAGADWTALTRIGCTTGPGSFTGLRVGLAAAKGLALALGKPGIGVSVFQVLARQVHHEGQPFIVVQDARREQLYVQHFNGARQALNPPAVISAGELPGDVSIVFGTGALIAQTHRPDLTVLDGTTHPLPQALVACCWDAEDAPLTPLYLRSADAKPQAALVS